MKGTGYFGWGEIIQVLIKEMSQLNGALKYRMYLTGNTMRLFGIDAPPLKEGGEHVPAELSVVRHLGFESKVNEGMIGIRKASSEEGLNSVMLVEKKEAVGRGNSVITDELDPTGKGKTRKEVGSIGNGCNVNKKEKRNIARLQWGGGL